MADNEKHPTPSFFLILPGQETCLLTQFDKFLIKKALSFQPYLRHFKPTEVSSKEKETKGGILYSNKRMPLVRQRALQTNGGPSEAAERITDGGENRPLSTRQCQFTHKVPLDR